MLHSVVLDTKGDNPGPDPGLDTDNDDVNDEENHGLLTGLMAIFGLAVAAASVVGVVISRRVIQGY